MYIKSVPRMDGGLKFCIIASQESRCLAATIPRGTLRYLQTVLYSIVALYTIILAYTIINLGRSFHPIPLFYSVLLLT